MPSTRSSAATKCISEVPGLLKQTSTPPATRVRTRLSAPFIRSTPVRRQVSRSCDDQPLFAHFVKGGACMPISRGRGLRNAADYGLSCDVVRVSKNSLFQGEEQMTRGFLV